MIKIKPDLNMMLIIYKHEQVNDSIWFSKLVEEIKLPRVEVSKLEDKLYDLGLLNMKYEKVENKWTNCYHIEDEAKYLLEQLARHVVVEDTK
jgi:hypothetical protein